jgi:hypothetical protein
MSYVDVVSSNHSSFAAALRSDGQIVAWGNNANGQCNVPPLTPGTTYVEFGLGDDHGVALTSDGTVKAWGSNSLGQLNVPQPPVGLRYVGVAAKYARNLALRSDGVLVPWGGPNTNGELAPPPVVQGYRVAWFDVGYDYNIELLTPIASSYCTAGTSTNGCVPSISALGYPSASATSGFTIATTQLEGQKQGLFFYSLTGRHSGAWGESLLCVKAPTQRTPAMFSGGTAGQCDGSLSFDWLDYVATHPAALGVPFASGMQVGIQTWYRDPPSPKTTNLSDALEFIVAP